MNLIILIMYKYIILIILIGKMELFNSNIKKFLIILFRKTETPKKVLIFQEMKLSYILGNLNFLYFVKGIFGALVYSEP